MADSLVLRLHDDARCEWLLTGPDGTRKSETHAGTLDEAAAQAAGRKLIVLLPAANILTLSTELNVRGRRLQAALPFALEDQLADDVEKLHFAPGKRLPDGRLPVAVLRHDRIQHYLDRLSDAGLEADRLLADYHGLDQVPNTVTMLLDGDERFLNDGHGVWVSLPEMRPVDIVAAAGLIVADGADREAPAAALQVYCDAAAREAFEADWAALSQELDDVDIRVLPDGPFPRLAVSAAAGSGINLLQGPYARKTENAELFRPWRTAAVLLLGLVLLAFGGRVAELVRLGQEEAALREQFTVEYRELAPNDNREIMDPVAAVNSLRRRLGGSTGNTSLFMPGMQALATALGDSGSRVEAISYRAGVMDVRLVAPDVSALDRIQQKVNESTRFSATIQSTTQSEAGVNSRIQIREAGV